MVLGPGEAISTEPSKDAAGAHIAKGGDGAITPAGEFNAGDRASAAEAENSPTPPANVEFNLTRDGTPASTRQVETSGAVAPQENAPPNILQKAYDGIDQQAGSCVPPDTDGAVGLVHYVQTVNCRVQVYDKASNAVVLNTTLAGFMGSSDFTFDPRAVYDTTAKRFGVLATRKAASSTDTVRRGYIAVSTTSNGTGTSWYRYNFTWSGPAGEWCDFPQLGQTQDHFIITCNNFILQSSGASNFNRVIVFAIPKARVYNGWGFGFSYFQPPNAFSVAPPVVGGIPMEQSGKAFLIEANSAADSVRMWRFEPAVDVFVLQATIPVPAWDVPFCSYNGAGQCLDALDGRFQQNSYQIGNLLWNVHTETMTKSNGSSYNVPRYYAFNTAANNINKTGVINSGLFDEWGASLAVNSGNEVFATWVRTSTATNVQIMRGGCQSGAGDCDANIGDTAIIHASSNDYILNLTGTRNRFGDYSSVEVDPSVYSGCYTRRAWATNEYANNSPATHTWDTRIFQFGFC